MTKKVKGFENILNVNKVTLKTHLDKHNSLHDGIDYDEILKDLTKKSIVSLMTQIKEEYPDMPFDVIEAFVKTYFLFELDNEYDIKSMEYTIKITPVWKDFNLINTESEEFKLLSEYALSELGE